MCLVKPVFGCSTPLGSTLRVFASWPPCLRLVAVQLALTQLAAVRNAALLLSTAATVTDFQPAVLIATSGRCRPFARGPRPADKLVLCQGVRCASKELSARGAAHAPPFENLLLHHMMRQQVVRPRTGGITGPNNAELSVGGVYTSLAAHRIRDQSEWRSGSVMGP